MEINIATFDLGFFTNLERFQQNEINKKFNIALLAQGGSFYFSPNEWKCWLTVNKVPSYKKINEIYKTIRKNNEKTIRSEFHAIDKLALFDFNLTGELFLKQFYKFDHGFFKKETLIEYIKRVVDLKIEGKYVISPCVEEGGNWNEESFAAVVKQMCNQILYITDLLKDVDKLKIEYVLSPRGPFIDYYEMHEIKPEYPMDYNSSLELGLEEEKRMNDETDGFWGFEQEDR